MQYNVNVLLKVASTWQIQVLPFGTFWDFLFPPNMVDVWLVESMGMEPVDMEGWLYTYFLIKKLRWKEHLKVFAFFFSQAPKQKGTKLQTKQNHPEAWIK